MIVSVFWSGIRDSNPRLSAWEAEESLRETLMICVFSALAWPSGVA